MRHVFSFCIYEVSDPTQCDGVRRCSHPSLGRSGRNGLVRRRMPTLRARDRADAPLDRRQRIAFIDVQSAQSCPLDAESLLARFHAQEADGPLVSGAAAFAALWRAIPLLRPLGLAAQWPPLLKLLELGYIAFLRFRPALQRLVRRAGLQ